ncbi:unnamed protein product [Urochloa humidicola]
MGNAPATAVVSSSCSTSTIIAEELIGTHILRVDGYSGTKGLGVGKSINSGTFAARGHSWYIAYYPDSEDEDCTDWISVSLCLDRQVPRRTSSKHGFSSSCRSITGLHTTKT